MRYRPIRVRLNRRRQLKNIDNKTGLIYAAGVEEYKKQALEAEEKFKKVQSIMAKQIISGSVGIRHSSNVVDNNMSLLQTHQQHRLLLI